MFLFNPEPVELFNPEPVELVPSETIRIVCFLRHRKSAYMKVLIHT